MIDDNLMEEALSISDTTTKKEVVDKALRLLIDVSKQKAIARSKGKLHWHGDLDSSRTD